MSIRACPHVRVCCVAALMAAFLVVYGCATPVGVRHLDRQEEHRRLTASVLTGGKLSDSTTHILNRSGLAKQFDQEPNKVIATLHKGLPMVNESDRLFALAELSYLHATTGGSRGNYLAAAAYAYAFLFPGDQGSTPDAFDPRLRVAVNLYNQSLAAGFRLSEGGEVVLRAGTFQLPFGELTVAAEAEEFRRGSYRLVNFVEASRLGVRGLRNDYTWPGIGTALVASLEPVPGAQDRAFARVPPTLKLSVTAFLRFDRVEEGLKTGSLQGRLELLSEYKTDAVAVGGRKVPLEFRSSAALAYTLEGSRAYKLELKAFLSGNLQLFQDQARFKDNVFLMAPYRPGLIPVVLVHGTASSPATWAEMINELINDEELRTRYQLWLFTYNTGNPVVYSGGILAEGLQNVIRELDPEGKDGALRKMVVIGHSQGGLLTKLTVIDSGTRFWDNGFTVPIDQLDLKPETRALLRRSLFYQPLPFVRRVVFISTPHGGSFVSGGWIGRMAGKLVSLPFRILDPLGEVFAANPDAVAGRSLKDMPKSTDNMDPKSPFIKILSSIPVAPGVTAHSIIPVKNPGDPKEKWNDGVVEYKSAHIDGVASELIVQSGHSAQMEAQAIEEVRRILLENLKEP
jgi:pimeloyl-ACP methyl ester carboxylesterase